MTEPNCGKRSPTDSIAIPDAVPHVRLEIVSDARMLAPVRGLVNALAHRLGFADVDASHVSLAVDEVLANVIRHGYDRRPDGRIFLRIWCMDDGPRGLLIVVEDDGKQVDPSCFRSRDLDDLRPGGLGVHIIREVMDGCRFEPRRERGMRAVLVKWLPPTCSDGLDHEGKR